MISANCELIYNEYITKDIFQLTFVWQASNIEECRNFPVPKAGQFYMIKYGRSSVFLARPISLYNWMPKSEDRDFIRRKARNGRSPYQRYLTGKFLESDTITFLIAKRGRGTLELAEMRSSEWAELTGPLGNSWTNFLPPVKEGKKQIALVGGGIGIAPLSALLFENPGYNFHLYAGFKKGLKREEKLKLLGPSMYEAGNTLIAAENGKDGEKGLITDFLEPEKYDAVCACGPQPMLKVIAEKCKTARVPCYISMERRMACGTGACLGCTVETINGNQRCCADGPIFKAEEVIFNE